ncbi:MAG: Gmad2 immunoglobulin-like domain-containing protein [Candidatus Brennerbacteria bacterium]|nr:Gmad2 immunoglobulin-like domain-containing protein [Candidatus Brennerbacteria bacterium]
MNFKIWLGIVVALVLFGAAGLYLAPQEPEKTLHTEKSNLIVVDAPRRGERISSPLIVTGRARGNWYFEASFPIEILDAEGNVIGQGYAETKNDWMTEEFVPFESISIPFSPQAAESQGTLILRRDNPSGLPEHDDALEVPVIFE